MSIRSLVDEARRVGSAVTAESEPRSVGPIGVSGMLAEQLAKELSTGAEPGTVVGGGVELAERAEVLVRVVAGDPSDEDEGLVRAADRRGVPVVVVQLWPQADWTKPFVLTPFVVECRAGEGFPVSEIADRIVEAAQGSAVLASRAPVIADASRSALVKHAVIRSAFIGLSGSRPGSRQPLTLAQIGMLVQLRSASGGPAASDELPVRAGAAAAVVAAGFAFRGVARSLRRVVPSPIAQAAIAAGGTWALARAYAAAEAHERRI